MYHKPVTIFCRFSLPLFLRSDAMTRRRRKIRTAYILTDFLTANIVFLLFDICRYFMQNLAERFTLDSFLLNWKILLEQGLIPLFVLMVYGISGFYNEPERRSRITELITTALSAIVVSLVIYLMLLVNDMGLAKVGHYKMIVILFGLFFVVTYIGRYIITTSLFNRIRRGNLRFNTVIVGNSPRSRKVAQSLVRTQSLYGYNIVGFMPVVGESIGAGDVRLLNFEDLRKLVDDHAISDVIIALENDDDERTVLSVMNRLFEFDISIKVAAGSFSYLTSGIRLEDIYGEPLLEVSCSQLSECARNLKRLGDIVASALSLVVLAIPMAVVALAVKIDSPGPALYHQERIGHRRRPFRIHKFRTMVAEAEAEGPRLSSRNDARVTRLGRFLRKYRIDELPQFWNVLLGEMALVGPRPERAYYMEKIVRRAPYYTLLQQVRPGLTSWGMVKYGYASNVEEMIERSKYDLLYIGNMSLTVDMKILIYTIRTVLTGRGV